MTTIAAQQRLDCYRAATKQYTSPGVDRFKRHWEFIKDSPGNTAIQSTQLVSCIALGMCVGGVIGLKVSQGRKLVGAIGAAVGAGGGVVFYVTATEKRKVFKDWIAVTMDRLIDAAAILKYSDDPVLAIFVCPVSQVIPLVPTRTPNGHLFDLNYLRLIPKDQKGHTPCPMRGDPFNVDVLDLDTETALVINKRLLYLIQEDIAHADNDPEIKKTLASQAEVIKSCIRVNYFNSLAQFDHRLSNNITNSDQCAEERAQFIACFGQPTDMGLKWDGVNWKTVLDQRWLKLHPNSIILNQ